MEADSMNAKETARLIDWLEAHGHTEAETIQCIKFIATGINPESNHNESTEDQTK